MKPTILAVLTMLMCSTTGQAQFLNSYKWKSRMVLLFTPATDNPLYLRQLKLLADEADGFEERKLVFLSMTPDGSRENTGRFLDKALAAQYYDYFNANKRQFEMILVGLDGTEKFRAQSEVTPVSVLFELIDGMPMRKSELRRAKRNGGSGD